MVDGNFGSWTPRVIEGGKESPLKADLTYFKNEILSTSEWRALVDSSYSDKSEAGLDVCKMSKETRIDIFRQFVVSFKNGTYMYDIHNPVLILAIYNDLN